MREKRTVIKGVLTTCFLLAIVFFISPQNLLVRAADDWSQDILDFQSYGQNGWTVTEDDVPKWSASNAVSNLSVGDPSENPMVIPRQANAESVAYTTITVGAGNILNDPVQVTENVAYYEVYFPEQLRWAMTNQKSFRLMNDIDLDGRNGKTWSSVGVSTKMFIDGNGYTIYNLQGGTFVSSVTANLIVQDFRVVSAKLSGGLFGGTSANICITLEKVSLEYALVEVSSGFAGGLLTNCYYRPNSSFARVYANQSHTKNVYVKGSGCSGNFSGPMSGVVENCYSIDGTMRTGSHSGGFTSCAGNYIFRNCFSNVRAYAQTITGAFVGHPEDSYYTPGGSQTSQFIRCYTSGAVEGNSATASNLGGFVGGTGRSSGRSAAEQFLFEDCYTTAMVGMNGNCTNQGGFIGNKESTSVTTIRNCYAAGEVGTETTQVGSSANTTLGGFVGTYAGSFIIENSYYDKQTTAMRGQHNAPAGTGLTGLLTKELTQTNLDSSTWELTEGVYPQLKVFMNASQLFDDERDVLTALAYSEASVCTPVLYPSNLRQEDFDEVIKNPENYDTVRDIRFVFPFTNDSMVNDSKFSIHWWANPAYTCNVEGMVGLPIILLKPEPDYGVDSLTPGIGWASVSVELNGVSDEYKDIVGKRNLRLIPRTALTVAGSAGTDETIYAMPKDPDGIPVTTGWKESDTEYDHRNNVYFTYVAADQSVVNAKVAPYPTDGNSDNVELEDNTAIKLSTGSLKTSGNEEVPGDVFITITKDDSTTPLVITEDLLKLLYGERKAELEDIGIYTLTYRWYAGGSNTSYLESQKKLTVKEAYWLDYRYNFKEENEDQYHEDPGAYRNGDNIFKYQTIRTDEPYTYPDDPEREGYEFLGWSTNRDGFGTDNSYRFDKDTLITSSLKLYAQWRALDYSLTYNGNGHTGGTVPTDGNTYIINNTVTVQDQGSMVKKNYSFVGWNTEKNGTGDWYYPDQNDEIVFGAENIILYAQWNQNKTTSTDVSITKTVENCTSPNGPTRVGDLLEYTITATNNSDSVWTDVILSDTIPEGLKLVDGSITLTYPDSMEIIDNSNQYYEASSRTIKSPATDLELDEKYTLIFKAEVTAAAMNEDEDYLGNKAKASGKDWEGGEVEKDTPKVYPPGEDGNGREKPYWKNPASYIMKSVNNNDAPNGPTTVGDELEYTIMVSNNELDSMWKDVVLTDLLPSGVTFVPDSITGQWDDDVSAWDIPDDDGFKKDYKDGKDAIVYSIGNVKGGASFTLTFKAVVNEGALSENKDNELIMNQAAADGKKPYGKNEEEEYEGKTSEKVYPPDGDGGSGGRIRYKDPSGNYKKVIANKTGESDSTAVEDVLTYIITAENKKANSLWDDVTITDVLPLGMELVPGTIYIQGPNDKEPVLLKDEDVYDSDSRMLQYNVGKIYGNELYELSFDVKITAAAMAADTDEKAHKLVRNTAKITGTTPDGEDHGGETDPVYPPGTGKEEEGGDGGRVRWKNPKGNIEKSVINQNQDEYSVIGDILSYTLTAENKVENSCWEDVKLTDKLPKGLEFVPGSAVLVKPDRKEINIPDGDIFDAQTNTLSYTIGNIYGNEKYELIFDIILTSEAVEKDENGNDQVGNTAYGKGKRPDGGIEEDESKKVYPPGYEDDETGGIRYKEPDGNLRKNVYGQNEGISTVGDTLEYILTADNYEAGSLWKNVAVTDKLPLGLTFVEGSVKVKEPGDSDFKLTDAYSYDEKSRIFSYQIGDIYGGESYAVSFEVTLNENAVSEEEDNETVWNTAEASGGTPGGKTEEDGSDGVYPPDGEGKDGDGGKGGRIRYKDPKGSYTKVITGKSGDPDSTAVDDILTYTISAENKKADSLWKDVEITDKLPLGMELIPGTIYIQGPDDAEPLQIDDSAYNSSTRTISYIIDEIYGNQKYELSFDVVITAAALAPGDNEETKKLIGNKASVNGTKPGGEKDGGDTNTVYPPGTGGEDGGKIRYKNPSGKVEKQVKNISNSTGITVVDDILEYTLVIENEEENSLWENVLVEDQLPVGTVFISGSAKIKGPQGTDTFTKIADEDIYIDSESKLSYVIDQIYGGEVYTIVFRVQVNGKAVSDTDDTIGNEFTASGDQPDGKRHKKRSPKVYPPGVGQPGGSEGGGNVQWKDPDPMLTKTTRNEEGRVNTTVGDILTYTLTISNHEKDSIWENVIVRDDLPQGVTYLPESLKIKGPGESGFTSIPDQDGYHDAERRIEYVLGNVYGNETYIIEFSVVVNEYAVSEDKNSPGIRNTAAANGEKPGEGGSTDEKIGGPSYPVDEDGEPSGRVRYKDPEPGIKKSVVNNSNVDEPTQVGDILTYTITVTNQKKNSLWDDVTVYDVLPSGMTFVEDSIMLLSPGGTDYVSLPNTVYNAQTRTIEYYIGPIYGNEVYELIFDVQINENAVTADDNTAELVGNRTWAAGKRPGGEEQNTDKTDPILPPGIDEETRVDFRKPVGGIDKAAKNKNRKDATTVVGDIIEYSISVSNSEEYSVWRDALLKDDMPVGVEIKTETMVLKTPNGQKVVIEPEAYSKETRTVAVYLGDITYGETYTLTFQAEVTPDAIGRNIGNLAAAWTSLNRSTGFSFYPGYPYEEELFGRIPEDEEDRDGQEVDPEEDDYVYVEVPDMVYPSVEDDPEQGDENDPDEGTNTVLPYDPEPDVTKEVENLTHPEGDTRLKDRIRYTITLSNRKENSVWKNLSIMDYLPEGMMLDLGSMVLIHPNGREQTLSSSVYNNSSRLLVVPISEINGGESYTLIYEVEVYVDDVEEPENEPPIVNKVEVPGENPDGTPTEETPEDSAEIDYPKDAKKRPRGSVEIIKVDAEDSQIRLGGAKFLLYWYNPEAKEYQLCSDLRTTGEKGGELGKILFTDLPEGEYRLDEIIAPDNYKKPEGEKRETYFELNINDDESALILYAKDREYTLSSILIPNEKLKPGDLQITKVDKDYHEILLEGAEFRLEKIRAEQETEVEEESDEEIKETDQEKEQEDQSESAGDIEPDTEGASVEDIEEQEEEAQQTAEISPNEVPDVQTGDDSDVEKYWTGKTNMEGLLNFEIKEPGRYRLTETAAPEDYLLGEKPYELEFEVEEEGGELVITTGIWSVLVENQAKDPQEPEPPVEPVDPTPIPDPDPDPTPRPEQESETEKETVKKTVKNNSDRSGKGGNKVPPTSDAGGYKQMWLLVLSGFIAVTAARKKRISR